MNNELTTFENSNFGKIRVLDINGKPWFVGKDITNSLFYQNNSDVIKAHVNADDKTTVMVYDGKQNRKLIFINKSGLNSLFNSSNVPDIKKYKRWIMNDILPSIRKSDFINDKSCKNKLFVVSTIMIKIVSLFRIKHDNKNNELINMAHSKNNSNYNGVEIRDTTYPVSIIAKDYGMTAISFNKLLNGLGIQYCMAGTWLLYSKYCDKGYTITRTYHVNESITSTHTYWTLKGRYFIYDTLKKYGILPVKEKVDIYVKCK